MLLRINKLVSVFVTTNKFYLLDSLTLNIYILHDDEIKLIRYFNKQSNDIYIDIEVNNTIQNLMDSHILVTKDFEEYEVLRKYRNAVKEKMSSKKGRYSYIRISLTENCNLRCKYCFVNKIFSEKSNMTEEKFFEVLNESIIENTGKEISVHYFGGEPILRLDMIKEGHKLLTNALESNTIKNFKEEIVTNGTLVDKQCAQDLTEMGIDVVFSIDGWKEINDSYRVYPNGEGSYDDLLKGIENLRNVAGNNSINLIMTPTDDFVLNQFKEIIEFIIANIKPDSITINAPQPYKDGWHVNGTKLAEAIINTWDLCENNSIIYTTPANSYIHSLRNKSPQVANCMATNDNGWGIYISSSGVASPCVVERVDDEIGLEIFNSENDLYRNGWHYSNDSDGCQNCKYINICSGLCSMEKKLLNGGKNYEKCKFTDRIVKWIITGE